MSLSGLASIGSLISGVAVLISLIYLALQVRQAERNQRALMQQGRADRNANVNLRTAERDMVDAVFSGNDGAEDLSLTEFRQFYLAFSAALWGFEDTFFQHRHKMLANAMFESSVATMRAAFSRPGYRAAWTLTRARRDPTFRAFVDQLIEEARAVPPVDIFGAWKVLVAEERSAAPMAGGLAGRERQAASGRALE